MKEDLKEEQKITIQFPKEINVEDFMKQFLEEHPEHAENIKLAILKPKDSNGVELQSGQTAKVISTGQFVFIRENKFFNEEGVEIDFQHNGKNVYEDLKVLPRP